MENEVESALWEEIYRLRLEVEGLETMLLLHKPEAFAAAHAGLLESHIARLPNGTRKAAALRAFDMCGVKSKAARAIRLSIGT